MTRPLRIVAGVTLAVCAFPASLAMHEWLHAANEWAHGSTEPIQVTYPRPWWMGGDAGLTTATAHGLHHSEGDHAWIYPAQALFLVACLVAVVVLLKPEVQ